MVHKMRKAIRQISPGDTLDILKKGEYGVLSTVDTDGQPYGVPLSYVLLEERIYFHCAKEGHKLQNLAGQPQVSFTVVINTRPVYDGSFTTEYESAIVFGKAAMVEDAQLRVRVFRELCLKYLPGHMDKFAGDMRRSADHAFIYGISMDHVTGKARHAAPDTGERSL